MLGHISTHWLRQLYAYLDAQGADPVAVLGRSCPPAGELSRIAVSEWRTALERSALALDDPALGLHLGATIRLRELGLLSYVLSSAPTLGEALFRLQRFERLVYQVNPGQVRFEGDRVILEWGTENGRPGQLVDETAIAALVQCTRELMQDPDAAPVHVGFVNPAPAETGAYEQYFGLMPAFGAPTTTVEVPVTLMGRSLPAPDPSLLAILERQADSLLAQIPGHDGFEVELRRGLVAAIAAGEPTLERLARALSCSPRTVQRRLDRRRLSFQAILDQCRGELAEQYLADPAVPLSEIALLLGYSEQSAFNRAFRRWRGQAPGQFRRQKQRQATQSSVSI